MAGRGTRTRILVCSGAQPAAADVQCRTGSRAAGPTWRARCAAAGRRRGSCCPRMVVFYVNNNSGGSGAGMVALPSPGAYRANDVFSLYCPPGTLPGLFLRALALTPVRRSGRAGKGAGGPAMLLLQSSAYTRVITRNHVILKVIFKGAGAGAGRLWLGVARLEATTRNHKVTGWRCCVQAF